MKPTTQSAFTLIELAIVLVVIGLIIGGILVGQDLIAAAGVRAQIAQIEKFQTATNTFRDKYGYLPGDINAAAAAQFGFAARGTNAGEGDGNGLIEGVSSNAANRNRGYLATTGETGMFWVDLSKAGLIEGGFNSATPNDTGLVTSEQLGNSVGLFFPAAKLGNGNYIDVWSGGWTLNMSLSSFTNDGSNYFSISNIQAIFINEQVATNNALTVKQAYNIDTKIDDGLPQFGRVMALYPAPMGFEPGATWAGGTVTFSSNYSGGSFSYFPGDSDSSNTPSGGPVTASSNQSTAPNPYSCYDNNSTAGSIEYYSLTTNASQVNCALSFRFQ